MGNKRHLTPREILGDRRQDRHLTAAEILSDAVGEDECATDRGRTARAGGQTATGASADGQATAGTGTDGQAATAAGTDWQWLDDQDVESRKK
jgi:hypothetical protein